MSDPVNHPAHYNKHMSPLEHPARPMMPEELSMFAAFSWEREGNRWGARRKTHYCGNFEGWIQLRKEIPGEAVFRG